MFIAFGSEWVYVFSMDGGDTPPAKPPRGRKRPRHIMELHMTFLPKAFRTQELVGLLAAIPAAALGSAFFLYLLDVTHRLTV